MLINVLPHVFRPFCISLNTLFIISGSSLKFANSLTIRSLISSIDAGPVENTFPFTKPQRNKSHGVKSSERGATR